MIKKKSGFTFIEILVVITIIGILIGLSAVAYSSVRKSGRDARRRGDLEQIRSALEIYRTDCGDYPARSAVVAGQPLVGDGSPSTCSSSNTYLSSIPADPLTGGSYQYQYYASGDQKTYNLCAYLEKGSGTVNCNGSNENCGTSTCNYKVTNP